MKIYIFFTIIILSFIVFYLGCDDTSVGIDDKIIPETNVSFSQHIFPIFNAKCVNCHGVGSVEGGVNLTNWAGATAPDIVVRSDPDNSPLVWSIQRIPGIPAMPPEGYVGLTEDQIEGIITWIKEGAKNN